MENTQDVGFEEFMSGFDAGPDYQDEAAEEIVDVDTETETDGSAPAEDGDAEADTDQLPADAPTVAQEQPNAEGDTFTLKVNKEERTCTREEVISLAQKGADYDRVKDQLTESRQAAADLQGKLDEQQEAMDVLSEVAKDAGVAIPALLDNLRMGLLKKQGLSDDAAKERLARLKTEKENAQLKAAQKPTEKGGEEDSAQRVRRELSDFRSNFPNVELTDALLEKLMPDVAAGKSLTDAYRGYETSQKDDRIAELERQLAAEKQNKENRASSPGSQKDSGGRRTKDDFDDFMRAFE
jgi:hypothetical protein